MDFLFTSSYKEYKQKNVEIWAPPMPAPVTRCILSFNSGQLGSTSANKSNHGYRYNLYVHIYTILSVRRWTDPCLDRAAPPGVFLARRRTLEALFDGIF